TKRLVDVIRQQCLGTTFHALAEQTGVAVNTVKNIARDLIEELVVVKFFWTRRSDGRVMHRRATGRQGWPAFRTVRVIGSQVLNA
ncbi:transposase family protein, partial [Klebsiella pneumoniae]|nr:transposase family protein [Klebsiella pneumoniae]